MTSKAKETKYKKCKCEGCIHQGRHHGYCQTHYKQIVPHVKTGRGGHNKKLYKDICIVDDCANEILCKDMCSKHYQRTKRHGDPLVNYHAKYSDRENYLPIGNCNEEQYHGQQ